MPIKQRTVSDILPKRGLVQFVGIDEMVARALPIEADVGTWGTEPFGSYPMWPVTGVEAPQHTQHAGPINDRTFRWRSGAYLCPEWAIVIWEIEHGDGTSLEVRAYPRASDEHYWPSEQECRENVKEWARRLYDCMMQVVGEDCDTGTGVSPACHWTDAKRRYTVKNNQTCALLYCARLDPEGRHRCNPSNRMPPHMERYIRYADFLCGVMAGVDPDEITTDDMYASGGAIESEEMLAWCHAMWASGLKVQKISP